MTAKLHHPDQLITASELEPLLGGDNLRVFDCTTYLIYESGTGRPYTVKSGAEDYAAGHIPHSAFIDLQGQLSEITTEPWQRHVRSDAATAQSLASFRDELGADLDQLQALADWVNNHEKRDVLLKYLRQHGFPVDG